MEKKFVTLEAFEQYDKRLKEYIDAHDGLILDDEDESNDKHEDSNEE